MYDLIEHEETVNELLARYGVKFGIYKDNVFKEQLFPFDAIPRVIKKQEFDMLEKGLKQRVKALNLFLSDIYGEKKIIKDKVVPEEFVYASSGYLAQCEGIRPPKDIYSHISGIDLVQGKNGEWYVLEDNLRVPSGASYPMIARELCRKSSPKTFRNMQIEDNRNYADLLKRTMENVNTGGHNVILTPGRYNAAYFEHSYLAERTGAHLANGHELTVENDRLYFIGSNGKKEPVGAVYRRISDEYLDPMNFNEESVIGIPHIFDVFRKGNVALINAPGNGIAYDNAIELRDMIGSEALSYIQLAIYGMNRARQSEAPLVEMQKINDNILAFWGITDDMMDDEKSRNTIKVGKRVERIDLYGRLKLSEKEMRREVHRLLGRIDKCCLDYNKETLRNVSAVVESDNIDYYRVVQEIERILE